MRSATRVSGAVAVAVSLSLPACSSGDGSSAQTGPQLKARLTTARATLDGAPSLGFDLTTPRLPSGVKGLLEASGTGNHDPAFRGKVKVSVGGSAVSADVVAVDGKVLAKTGFSPSFIPLDPASLGAPDPASLMRSDQGVSSLLTSTTSLEAGKKSRDGSEVLTSITGALPGTAVQNLIPTASAGGSFDARYRLTDADVLRDATITGPFYAGGKSVTYTIKITASDQSVVITAP